MLRRPYVVFFNTPPAIGEPSRVYGAVRRFTHDPVADDFAELARESLAVPLYAVGPFRTMRAARLCVSGAHSPHLQHVEEYEREAAHRAGRPCGRPGCYVCFKCGWGDCR